MNCFSCGCALTATTKKGLVYYYCTNGKRNCEQHKKYLRDKAADDLVAEVFNEIKFETDDMELAYEGAKERIQGQHHTYILNKTSWLKISKLPKPNSQT